MTAGDQFGRPLLRPVAQQEPQFYGSTGDRDRAAGLAIDDALRDLAELASQTIPGNNGVGATMMRDGVPVFRSSNGLARDIDRIQYRLGEGPCISAVEQGVTVEARDLGGAEERWPTFRAELSTLPVRSVLSVPMLVADRVLGSINAYASRPNAFDEQAVAIGTAFAQPAASSLSSASLLISALDLASFAAAELRDRALIETAVGVLIARLHVPEPTARRRLTQTAVAAGMTMTAAAEKIIADVHRPTPPPT